jgi:hypothetical protein
MLSTRWLIASLALMSTAVSANLQAQDQLPFVDFVPSSLSGPSLADKLTRSKSRVFFDYARDSTAVATLLVDPNGAATILAPTDSAVLALERRPHQGPLPVETVDGEVSSNEEERQRAEWLERWVKGHVVLEKVDLEGEGWEEREYTTMEGKRVRFVPSGASGEGRKLVPGDIEVVGEEQVRFISFLLPFSPANPPRLQASNGKLIYIQGTLSLD